MPGLFKRTYDNSSLMVIMAMFLFFLVFVDMLSSG